jgi:hypothetical protein
MAILQNLSNFSLVSSSFVSETPPLEHDIETTVLDNLWASVDYTTMSKSSQTLGSTQESMAAPSFDPILQDRHTFDSCYFLPTPDTTLSSGAVYPDLYHPFTPDFSFV